MKVSAFYLRAIGSHGRILSRGALHFRKASLVAVGVEDGMGVRWQLWESKRGARSCSLMLPVELRGGCTLGFLSEDEIHRS